jgi:hypothetical protein
MLILGGGGGRAGAQLLASDSMRITVRTGGDDLRDSSSAMLSVQHPNGTWSSEQEISTGGAFIDPVVVLLQSEKFANDTTYQKIISGSWDGLDPCATQVRIRLAQGPCFLCTDDNWNMDWVTIDYTQLFGGTRQLVAKLTGTRLTGSSASVTIGTNPPPAGTVCLNGLTADCSGHLFSSSVLTINPPFDQDDVCDSGPSGFNFMCEAFLFDSGACGLPPTWSPACSGFYADGECDCNDCGAWDPDCNNPAINSPSATVWNCNSGSICVNRMLSPGNYAPTCVVQTKPQ